MLTHQRILELLEAYEISDLLEIGGILPEDAIFILWKRGLIDLEWALDYEGESERSIKTEESEG